MEVSMRSFFKGEFGYSLLQDVGVIIAILCGFLLPDGHYIIAAVAIAILAKASASLPYSRAILWPITMGSALYLSYYHPTIIYGLLLGTGTSYYGIPIGLIYLFLAVVTVVGIGAAILYDRTEKEVAIFTIGTILIQMITGRD